MALDERGRGRVPSRPTFLETYFTDAPRDNAMGFPRGLPVYFVLPDGRITNSRGTPLRDLHVSCDGTLWASDGTRIDNAIILGFDGEPLVPASRPMRSQTTPDLLLWDRGARQESLGDLEDRRRETSPIFQAPSAAPPPPSSALARQAQVLMDYCRVLRGDVEAARRGTGALRRYAVEQDVDIDRLAETVAALGSAVVCINWAHPSGRIQRARLRELLDPIRDIHPLINNLYRSIESIDMKVRISTYYHEAPSEAWRRRRRRPLVPSHIQPCLRRAIAERGVSVPGAPPELPPETLVCPCCYERCGPYCPHHYQAPATEVTAPARRRIVGAPDAYRLWEWTRCAPIAEAAFPVPEEIEEAPLESPPTPRPPTPRLPPGIKAYVEELVTPPPITYPLDTLLNLKIDTVRDFYGDPKARYTLTVRLQSESQLKKLRLGEVTFRDVPYPFRGEVCQAMWVKFKPDAQFWVLLSTLHDAEETEIGRTEPIALTDPKLARVRSVWPLTSPTTGQRVATICLWVDMSPIDVERDFAQPVSAAPVTKEERPPAKEERPPGYPPPYPKSPERPSVPERPKSPERRPVPERPKSPELRPPPPPPLEERRPLPPEAHPPSPPARMPSPVPRPPPAVAEGVPARPPYASLPVSPMQKLSPFAGPARTASFPKPVPTGIPAPALSLAPRPLPKWLPSDVKPSEIPPPPPSFLAAIRATAEKPPSSPPPAPPDKAVPTAPPEKLVPVAPLPERVPSAEAAFPPPPEPTPAKRGEGPPGELKMPAVAPPSKIEQAPPPAAPPQRGEGPARLASVARTRRLKKVMLKGPVGAAERENIRRRTTLTRPSGISEL